MKLRANSEAGIAMIMVMLTIVVFAGLAGAFAYSMRVEMRLARNESNQSEVEWMARSGVELAKYAIAQQAQIPNEGTYEALNQKWAGGSGGTNSLLDAINLESTQISGGTISVKIIDMERRFNINNADQNFLQQALILIGVDAATFPTIVDSILDWTDADNNPRMNGAETQYYESLNPPYAAKNGFIDDMSEMLLIKGITPEIYWGAASSNHSVSAYQSRQQQRSGPPNLRNQPGRDQPTGVGLVDLFCTISSGRININTASVRALEMIPEIDENAANSIVQIRAGPDGVDGTADDVPFRNVGELVNVPGLSRQVVAQLTRYCDVRSHTFEVQVNVELNGVQRKFIALIRRNTQNIVDFSTLSLYSK